VWEQFRPAIGLQVLVTVVAALMGGWLAGVHGAISASVGGLIGLAGSAVFALIATRSRALSAGDVLVSAIKAEGAKLSLMIALLVIALMSYRDAVKGVLIGTFTVSAVLFGIAAFAVALRQEKPQKVEDAG